MCEMVVGQGVQVGDTKQMSNRTMQKEELIIPKKEGKKIFLNICVPSPALSVHTVKVESPGGLPAQAPWREKARGWVRDSKCRRTCLAEGGDTGRKKRDGQESGGQLTAGTEQAELHSYPGRPGA